MRARIPRGLARPDPHPADASGDDPIFALNSEAVRRREAGEEIVNSTVGMLLGEDERLATLAALGDAHARIPWERGVSYAPIAGPESFLQAVEEDLFARDPVRAAAVSVATPGGTGALALAVATWLEPGQRVLTSAFHWSPYETIATHARRELVTFSTFAPDGRFDAAALAAALAASRRHQGRSLLLLNTPCHNPSGYTLDERDWAALEAVLAREAAAQPLAVLLDLAYARYAPGDARAWLRHVAPLVGRVTWILAWSASKAFTAYGARVGACVVLAEETAERARLRAELGRACRGLWSNCNHLGMLAVTACLSDPELSTRAERERGELRALLARRAAHFGRLADAAALARPRYDGGFFTLVPCADSARVAGHMRARGVYVVPVAGAVRVALCSTPTRSLPRLVDALAAALRAETERERA